MSRLLILRLTGIALMLGVVAALAPAALADEPAPSGAYVITFYNYIKLGGASCPKAGAIPGGSESSINHFWPEWTSPHAGVNVNNYMVCWDGWLNFPVGGRWTVHTINDDGMVVWVNGQLTMDGWYDQGPSLHDGTIALNAGVNHVIIKYYNRTLGGKACVGWGPENNPIPFYQCPTGSAPPPPPPPKPTPKPKPPVCHYCKPESHVYPAPPPCKWCDVGCCAAPQKPLCDWCYGEPGYYPAQPVYYAPKPVYYAQPMYSCTYLVQWGDYLSVIAKRFGITTWQLMQLNGLYNPNYIYAGMVLRLC